MVRGPIKVYGASAEAKELILIRRVLKFTRRRYDRREFSHGPAVRTRRPSISSQPAGVTVFSCYVNFEPMDIEAQRQNRRDNTLSSLNAAIEALDIAGGISDFIPAKAVFGTVSVILTMIRVSFLLVHMVDRLRAELTRLGFHDQPGGLRRTWAGLRRRLHCP